MASSDINLAFNAKDWSALRHALLTSIKQNPLSPMLETWQQLYDKIGSLKERGFKI